MPAPVKLEKRCFKSNFETRSSDDGENVLEGYSAVFNSASEDMGWGSWKMYEYIAPGAFASALKNSDCRALFNHNPDHVLGRESAKTLLLTEDETGLRATIKLPDTQLARDLAVSVSRGDIKEQSFAFTVAKETWEDDFEKKISKRTILEIKELFDISVVTYPAYPDTDVAKRSYDEFLARQPGEDHSGDNAAADEMVEVRFKILELEEKRL